jgi:putative membrane protein
MQDNHGLDDAGRAAISDAVYKAEAGTAGEIVTIIADRSDRYQDVALWWAAGGAILALAALALFPDFFLGLLARLTNSWDKISLAEAFELALALAGLSFVATRLLLQWMPLRLWLTPRKVQANRVQGRAIRYFKVGAEHRTMGKTGILIYLSLSERMAEIVADEAIHSKVDQTVWGDAMAKLVKEAHQGRIADGMVAAIGDVGAILAANVPRTDNDVNELPDRVIEL